MHEGNKYCFYTLITDDGVYRLKRKESEKKLPLINKTP